MLAAAGNWQSDAEIHSSRVRKSDISRLAAGYAYAAAAGARYAYREIKCRIPSIACLLCASLVAKCVFQTN